MHLTPDEYATCVALLDAYAGPEEERTHWLANQWTSFGDDLDAEDWRRLESDAAVIIDLWRSQRSVQDAIRAGLGDASRAAESAARFDTASRRSEDALRWGA